MLKRFLPIALFCGALILTGAGCFSFGTDTTTVPVGPMGVFRSIDKGETWQQNNAYPTTSGVKSLAGVKVYRIFTDPSDPNALYLGTRGQGLFYSYDKGDSWQFMTALGQKYIYALVVDPQNKCVIFVGDEGGHIYKTSDCGRTWVISYTDQRSTERVTALTIDYTNGQTIYAALTGGDLFISTDSGVTWRAAHRFNAVLQDIQVDPLTPGRLYVASVESGLARSDDSGTTWISLSKSLQNFSDSLTFYRLLADTGKKDLVFWVSKYGILRSTDAGTTWSEVKLLTPPGSVSIYAFAVNPTNQQEMYYVGTVLGDNNSSRSTFYRSEDGGITWVTKKLPTNTIPVSLRVHPKENNIIYMGFTSL